MKPIIEFKELNFSYGKHTTLENINLSFHEGDFAAIIGPNGGGKTTLLNLVLGFLSPQTGTIKVYGRSPKYSTCIMGHVPQSSNIDNEFPITVLDVVLGGILKPSSFFPWNKRESIEKAGEALDNVSIKGLERKVFGTLSGGQKQRVLIARALVSDPKVLLLDEPTASVDSTVERDIYDIFKELNKKMTIILVTHDLGFVSSYINRVVCVNKKIKVHDPSIIDKDIIEDTYKSPMNVLLHSCRL